VILRVVRGRIRPGEREDVLAAIRDDYGPVVAATPGLLRFVLGIRTDDGDGDRIVAMSTWESLDAVHEAYGGNLATARTIDGPTRGAVYDAVSYYELVAHRIAAGASQPRLLRLTAGMVSRGLDADLQQELRLRLPDLPPEAVEAYVGRRVIGTSVEIAFMSTWTTEPGGVSLERPIWPDISERYDTFALEIHDIALAGEGAAASTAS
jgi:quinol monooxygenase YgiN